MNDDLNNRIKEILDDGISKNIARILLLALLIIVVVAALLHFKNAADGKHSRLLWGLDERNIPKGYPDTIVKQVAIHDTVNRVGTPAHKRHNVANSPKVETSAKELQNNEADNAKQTGREINDNGINQRGLTESDFKEFFDLYPDKNTRIGFSFVGSPTAEMLRLKGLMAKLFKKRGYANIGGKIENRQWSQIPSSPFFEPQRDGSVVWWIPPATN